MKGWDVLDLIKKQFSKKGTGTYPILFLDAENDEAYRFAGRVDTDDHSKQTVVYIEPAE